MPFFISHSAVGLALGSALRPPYVPRRFWVLAATLAALPDADLIGWPLGVPDTSLFSHRAITHSLWFAVVAGAVAAWTAFRGPAWAPYRLRLWAIFALATASHGFFDAFTVRRLDVEFFAPFSQARYHFAWQPLGGRDGPWGVLWREALLVLLPALSIGWGAWLVRRRRASRASPH
jgi:inner membrane protein